MPESDVARTTGLLVDLKTHIFSEGFKERNRQASKNFLRDRCLPFAVVVLFLLNMVKRSLQDELDEFFRLVSDSPVAVRVVSKSAWTQARRKLKYEAFIELNSRQITYFYKHFEPVRWNGYRLLATDGSMTELPNVEEICQHFGVWHPAAGGECPKARISQLFDVLNHVTIQALIEPKAEGERVLAQKHIKHLQPGDLFLMDRGYPAFWLFRSILTQNADFCARMNLSQPWLVVKNFVATGLPEQIVTVSPAYEAKKMCRELGLSTAPLTLRLLRIELVTGEVEVLITSLLDMQLIPHDQFCDLYHHRWPVEEDYKVIKSRIEVENWSGKTVLAIYQDFHAKVFTKNLTAILTHSAQAVVAHETATRQYTYQVNMTNALSKMKDAIVCLLSRIHIQDILQALWTQFTSTIEPIRPNRSVPRRVRVRQKNTLSLTSRPADSLT